MPFGEPLRFLESVDSTNTEAVRWLAEDPPPPEGAVVQTDYQSAGRGRWGRTWISEPGRSLMFSTILKPSFGVERVGLLTIAAGIACAEGMERTTGLSVSLKWPNDVLVGGKKVAGILAESQVTATRLDAAIVGMGINYLWPSDDLPEEARERATSLSDACEADGRTLPEKAELMGAILDALERAYRSIGDETGEPQLVERASARSDLLGSDVEVRHPDGRSTKGTARRILPMGQLEVTLPSGEAVVVDVGEVHRVRPT